MEIDPIIKEIERELERRDWHKKDFAEMVGVINQTYNHWRKRGIPDSYLPRIAEILGWDRDKLVFEREVVPDTGKVVSLDAIHPGPDNKGKVPKISWIQAGHWHEAHDPLYPGEAEDHVICPVNHGPNTYALRVEGDSMVSPWGASYPEGTIIYVDPDQAGGVNNGSLVIARVEGEDLVTFKKYVQDGGRHYLTPLNPQYRPLEDVFRILGKVIGAFHPTP